MSRRPRVLVVTPDFPPARGGIQLLVHRIVREVQRADVRVVAVGGEGVADWDARQALDVVRSPAVPYHRLSVLGLNAVALREALRWRPDVVLTAHIVGAPASAVICRLLNIPSILYVYGKELGSSPELAGFAVKRATATIVISQYTRRLALDVGANPRRLHLIPPGVDIVEARSVPRRETPTVVTVARLVDRYKGHDVVTRAMPLVRARVPDAQWIVVGDGPVRNDIERIARTVGITDAIRLLGGVSNEERDRWLDSSHVFVMPSRVPAGRAAGEGFGIVYLEAGLHGIPVVAGNVGGAVDAVVDGETGLLVDPTSPLAVADAIADLLLDPERARRMGEAGAQHARSFAWERIAPRVGDLVLEVVRGAA